MTDSSPVSLRRHLSVGLATSAMLLVANAVDAKNMGCCRLDEGCTTATAAVCKALGGRLEGIGTRICDADRGCVPGVGCATCWGGELAGQMCETPDACGDGGYCLTEVRLFEEEQQTEQEVLDEKQVYQYAVKFVCGDPEPRGVPLPRGRYATAINIHNPHLELAVRFRFKVAEALPKLRPGPITAFQDVELPADGAAEIDCPLILERLDETVFAKGFVVIQSRRPLDVVAVHTAAATPGRGGEVVSLDVEEVEPRIVSR